MADSSRPVLTRVNWLLAALVFILAVATDQASKMWARLALADASSHPLMGQWLSLRLIHNSGAAFSLGSDKTWVLTIFTVIIICFLAALLFRVRSFFALLAVALLMGGAWGNLIDRLTADPGFGVGHVTDFISYGNLFVGNVADIWIVLGALWLVFALSREPHKEPQ